MSGTCCVKTPAYTVLSSEAYLDTSNGVRYFSVWCGYCGSNKQRVEADPETKPWRAWRGGTKAAAV